VPTVVAGLPVSTRLNSFLSKLGLIFMVGTTDAIFLEKPACYDLLIDLTTSTPSKATRPTFYASKPQLPLVQPGTSTAPQHKLSIIRFAWSDIRLVSLFLSIHPSIFCHADQPVVE
jgi:hypothetical protein